MSLIISMSSVTNKHQVKRVQTNTGNMAREQDTKRKHIHFVVIMKTKNTTLKTKKDEQHEPPSKKNKTTKTKPGVNSGGREA